MTLSIKYNGQSRYRVTVSVQKHIFVQLQALVTLQSDIKPP